MLDYHLLVACLALGLGSGTIYGLFGSGSGLIMTPGFYYVLHEFGLATDHGMQIAIGTMYAVTVVLGLVAALQQIKARHVDTAMIRYIFPGLFIGSLISAVAIAVTPSQVIKYAFGCIAIFVGVWFWFYRQRKKDQAIATTNSSRYFVTILVGIGMATFTVPYLHACGLNIRRSIGTATVTWAILSAVYTLLLMLAGYFTVGASISHVGYINFKLLAATVIPSMIGAHLGVKMTHSFSQTRVKQLFAVLLFVIGVAMLTR